MLPARIPKKPKRATAGRSRALSRELLRSILHFEDGRLMWKERPREMFPDDRSWRTFNSRRAGREAFTCTHSAGYKTGRIFGRQFFAHRVIWAMVCGDPDGEIDHINGDRSDNRLENLRLVTREENRKNVKRQSNNKSGFVGIRQRGSSWEALIQVGGKQTYLGRYPTPEKAVEARKLAEAGMGFHPNHGRD